MTPSLEVFGNRFALFFPYSPAMVDLAKGLGGRWNKVQRYWDFPVSGNMYQSLKKEFGVKLEEFESDAGRTRMAMSKRKFKTKPYDHQIEALQFLLKQFGVDCDL